MAPTDSQSVPETHPKTNPTSQRWARLLQSLRGQPDQGAAFSYRSGPISASESSSEVIHIDKDLKDGELDVARARTDLQRHYAPIEAYEGRHRYDPTVQWTEKEEKTLVRRVSPGLWRQQTEADVC
jgi:hypothetical protein